MVPSACKLFAGIDDPRVVGRTTHSLAEILFAALCATLYGFGCCDGYAQFARAKVDFLRRYLPYKDHGDDPRQILTQGRLRPGVQADAEAAARMVGARAAC